MEPAVLDGDEVTDAPGAVGELLVRGRNVMKGYLNRPDVTAAAKRSLGATVDGAAQPN